MQIYPKIFGVLRNIFYICTVNTVIFDSIQF